jgi:hypothetical protein
MKEEDIEITLNHEWGTKWILKIMVGDVDQKIAVALKNKILKAVPFYDKWNLKSFSIIDIDEHDRLKRIEQKWNENKKYLKNRKVLEG